MPYRRAISSSEAVLRQLAKLKSLQSLNLNGDLSALTNRWVRPNPSPALGVLRAGPHARLRQSLSLFVLSVPRPLLLEMK